MQGSADKDAHHALFMELLILQTAGTPARLQFVSKGAPPVSVPATSVYSAEHFHIQLSPYQGYTELQYKSRGNHWEEERIKMFVIPMLFLA